MDILKGIRPLDYTLAALMVALAALIGYFNVSAGADAELAHPLDSQSVLIIPVLMLAALPILWRRRGILAVVAVSFVVLAISVPAFGWITRCGFALPLSAAMAYAVARFAGSRQNQVIGLVGILALQIVTLVKDASTGGLSGLSVGLPLAAICYGVGVFVQHRAATRATGSTPRVEHAHA